MKKPEKAQIDKLPKWAKEYITDLERDLSSEKAAVARFNDSQTPSPFYIDEWHLDPRFKRYVHTTGNRIVAEHAGVRCELYLPPETDSQRPFGIEIGFGEIGTWGHCEKTSIIPHSPGQIFIMHKDNMR